MCIPKSKYDWHFAFGATKKSECTLGWIVSSTLSPALNLVQSLCMDDIKLTENIVQRAWDLGNKNHTPKVG